LLTFNEITGGRAQTVIGGGGEVVMALSIPFDKRVRVVHECLELVKGASGKRPFSYNGELYHIKDYDPYWATAPAPLVYAAANRPQMLRMSAGVADGIMMSDLSPTLSKDAIDIVNKRLKEVDRNPKDFRINNFMAWYIYDDKEEARREAKRWIGFRAMFRKYMMEEIIGDEDFNILMAHMPQIYEMAVEGTDSVDGVPDSLLDVCVDKLTLTGDVNDLDHVIEHLIELKQAGITELSLELRKHVPQSIKLIGERVIPALRL
jgi:alkanesulfonate monooxygenase SsuD/methylene tetrahydromethanopterin reductase-like flavin-dependent oxidoreductase (luciferase family)